MASVEWIQRWLVSLVGLVAAIVGGYITTFKIQDKIYATRKAAAELKIEYRNYDYGIGYDGMDEQEAFIKFTAITSKILSEQMLQEVEIWNSKKEENETDKNTNNKQKKNDNETVEQTQKTEDSQSFTSEDQHA